MTTCHLVYLDGDRAGEAVSFSSGRITVGRASNCDFEFDPYKDLAVASLHAEILLDEDLWYIHDAGSRSGTFLNGQRVTQPTPLRHEDYIQFGKNGPEVIFRVGAAGPDPQPLPPDPISTAELEFLAGADAGKIFAIYGDQVTRIGRRSDLEVPLDPRGDMVVSGNHCNIQFYKGEFVLTDTSRNGTYVNGELLSNPVVLKDGDILTLGDGGPRARLVILPARRTYPNESRGMAAISSSRLDPVSPPPPPPPAAPPPEPRRPMPTFEPVEPTPAAPPPPAPERVAGMRAQVEQALREAGQVVTGSAGLTGTPEPPKRPQPRPTPTPGRVPAVQPARRAKRLSLPLLGAAGLGVLAVAGLIAVVALRPGSAPEEPPATGSISDYEKEIKGAEEKRIDALGYSVPVPSGWAVHQDGGFVSIESADKTINVDYVRDAGLSESSVLTAIGAGDYAASKLDTRKVGDVTVVSFVATAGGQARYAVLKQPAGDVPALAVFESPATVFEQLPRSAISAVVSDGFKLQRLQAEATPAPEPTATPAPTTVASVTPSPTPEPQVTPASTPEPRQTPVVEVAAPAAEWMNLTVPEGWSISKDQGAGVVVLKGLSGVEMRIARDAGTVNPAAVFDAMVADGWTESRARNIDREVAVPGRNDQPTTTTFSAAELAKGDSHIILLLVRTLDGSTGVIYAMHNKPFDRPQRNDVATALRAVATGPQ